MPADPIRHLAGRRSAAAGVLAVALLSAACGGGAAETAAETDPGQKASSAAFPVTIEHKYGSTEIYEPPERVVSVGFNDHDPILALGVTPVAVRDWFGDQPNATWPWAQDELGGAEPEVLSVAELNFEQITALNPDLIVGVFSGMTEKEYKTLSRIAPTVAQPGEYVDFGVPWQEQTKIIGRALGKQERAEDIVAQLEARFAEIRDQHPEFQSASGVVGLLGGAEANYHAYGPEDLRARFMTALGFELPQAVADLAGEQFFTPISREQLALVDADVLVWIVNSPSVRQELEGDPLYRNLEVVREGRDVFLDVNEPVAGALSFSTVLSLPFALDELVPQLAAAVDGDLATEAASAP